MRERKIEKEKTLIDLNVSGESINGIRFYYDMMTHFSSVEKINPLLLTKKTTKQKQTKNFNTSKPQTSFSANNL